MSFSKITSVEVTNFMVYSHAKLVFDGSNIVNIKGYNSSGKSSMLKAIGVCLTNMYPKSQTKLIKHGADFFRVVVSFSDGISILRDKYANGQSLYEMYQHGECIFTTKEGKKLSKVDDVPESIKAYLGLCETSYGYLNYQSRQDRLWLIETSGSENYGSLNEILKSEELARASALINSDKNKLTAAITEIEAKLQTVKMDRLAADGYTAELLEALMAKDSYVKELNRRMTAISRLQEISAKIGEVVILPEIECVDSSRLSAIGAINTAMSQLCGIKVPPRVDKVNFSRLQSAVALSNLSQQVAQGSQGMVGTKIPSVSVEKLSSLLNVGLALKKYFDGFSSYRTVMGEISEVSAELASVVKAAEDNGVHFVKCTSCGSYTEYADKGVTNNGS